MNIPISAFPNFQPRVPSGDNMERQVCSQCDWIHYENPRIIVSAICLWQDQLLLCRRAIAPRYGFWTLPGGFMEVGETMEEAAAREVFEEAGADVEIESLLATYSIPRIGQVHMVYLARMKSETYAAGTESLEVMLVPTSSDSIPWDDLAFPVNRWTFRDFLSLGGKPIGQPFRLREEDRGERLSHISHHPNFPPPASNCGNS